MTTATAEYSSVPLMLLNPLLPSGAPPQRAGDVRDQAVRVRGGDRADGIDGLVRVGIALRAQVDLEDGLDGLAVRRRNRAHDLAGHDAGNPGEPVSVRGRLGPVRGGDT